MVVGGPVLLAIYMWRILLGASSQYCKVHTIATLASCLHGALHGGSHYVRVNSDMHDTSHIYLHVW